MPLMPWSETILSFKTVIITGGSSGIGAELINTLAKLRSKSSIINLSRTKPHIFAESFTVEHIPTDLSDPESLAAAAVAVEKRIEASDEGPILLINNSGFGNHGQFASAGQDEVGMVHVNALAVVDLTQRLLPSIKKRGGWIMTISSVAGFQPTPYLATYGAAKAFVMHWSLALNEELRGTGVRTLAVCPGPTKSSFFRRAGFDESPDVVRGQLPEEVALEAYKALHKGKSLVVTGGRNKLMAFMTHFFSKAFIARIARKLMQRFRLEAKTRAQLGA